MLKLFAHFFLKYWTATCLLCHCKKDNEPTQVMPVAWSLWSRRKYLDSCEVFYLHDSYRLCRCSDFSFSVTLTLTFVVLSEDSKRQILFFHNLLVYLWVNVSSILSHLFPTLSSLPPLMILTSSYLICEVLPVLLEPTNYWMLSFKYHCNYYFVQPTSSHHPHNIFLFKKIEKGLYTVALA